APFSRAIERPPTGRWLQLKDDHGVPYANEIFHARGVPVCEANTTVACGAANCLGIIRPVNADAWFIQPHPENAHQVVRARWEIVIVLSAHTVVQHAFIVTEPWPDSRPQNFPCAYWRRERF